MVFLEARASLHRSCIWRRPSEGLPSFSDLAELTAISN
jgi:hypothetical protein